MTHIYIDRLHIRVRGVPAGTARSTVEGLALQILRELDSRAEPAGLVGRISIGHLAAVAVTAERDSGAAELRAGLARAAVDAIVPAANGAGGAGKTGE